jgi:hypothetical protein
MADFKEQYSTFVADGGLCALFVDDELPTDRGTLEAFLDSDVPGVVIPTTGSSSARLVCGGQVLEGNRQIRGFLQEVKNS